MEYDAESLDTIRPLAIMSFMPAGWSGSYTSLKGINGKDPIFFLHFCLILKTFGTEDPHKNILTVTNVHQYCERA